MLRLVFAIRRLPRLSLEEFHRYWLDQHGPLALYHSRALGFVRYVQNHLIDDELTEKQRKFRGTVEPYDGVVELWWNNRDELARSFTSREGRKAGRELLEDERNFIDFSRSSIWVAMELPQINPTPEKIVAAEKSTIIKIYFPLRRLPNLSGEEFQLYWRMNHGPLVRSYGAAARMLRYMQVHAFEDPLVDQMRKVRGGLEEPYDGHAETWLDRLHIGATAKIPEVRKAMNLFLEDEKRFIDLSRSSIFFVKEHVLYG